MSDPGHSYYAFNCVWCVSFYVYYCLHDHTGVANFIVRALKMPS